MLLGRLPNPVALDAKGRLVVPKQIREDVETREGTASLHVGHLVDRCLHLHTDEQHEEFLAAFEAKLGNSRRDRALKTRVYSSFAPVSTDKAGRITIPAFLLERAGISDKVIFIGMRERVELWEASNFESLDDELDDEELNASLEDVLGGVGRSDD